MLRKNQRKSDCCTGWDLGFIRLHSCSDWFNSSGRKEGCTVNKHRGSNYVTMANAISPLSSTLCFRHFSKWLDIFSAWHVSGLIQWKQLVASCCLSDPAVEKWPWKLFTFLQDLLKPEKGAHWYHILVGRQKGVGQTGYRFCKVEGSKQLVLTPCFLVHPAGPSCLTLGMLLICWSSPVKGESTTHLPELWCVLSNQLGARVW